MFAPAVNADLCVVPGVEEGVRQATLVFSGKIVSISRVPANNDNAPTSSSEFIVKFEVEAWWKGAGNPEIQVLWRTATVGCPYFPVGEVGERYLVYADPSKGTVAREERLPEVTIFNRTCKIPAKTLAVNQFEVEAQRKRPVLLELAEMNRFDASADIQVLRWLKECVCLASDFHPCMNSFGSLPGELTKAGSESSVASCCACFRRHLTSF